LPDIGASLLSGSIRCDEKKARQSPNRGGADFIIRLPATPRGNQSRSMSLIGVRTGRIRSQEDGSRAVPV